MSLYLYGGATLSVSKKIDISSSGLGMDPPHCQKEEQGYQSHILPTIKSVPAKKTSKEKKNLPRTKAIICPPHAPRAIGACWARCKNGPLKCLLCQYGYAVTPSSAPLELPHMGSTTGSMANACVPGLLVGICMSTLGYGRSYGQQMTPIPMNVRRERVE